MKSTQILLSLCLSLLIRTNISAQVVHTKDHTPTVTTYAKEFRTTRPTSTIEPAQALHPWNDSFSEKKLYYLLTSNQNCYLS